MQLTLINYKKLDLKAFSVNITIHESLPNNRWGKYIGRQFANMTLDGVQDPHINLDFRAFNKDLLPNEKQGIDKKYIPWVQSAIALFIEANHDIYPQD